MIIEVSNLFCTIKGYTPQELHWLRTYLSYENPNWRWQGTSQFISIFDPLREHFPTGLLDVVLSRAMIDNYTVTLVDKRPTPIQPDPNADVAWLYDWQKEAVEKCVKATRGIIWVVTGGGKTEIAIGVTRRLPGKAVFLTHRDNLREQAAERYEKRTGKRAGRIGDGNWDEQDFTCAMIQTLHAHRKSPKGKKFLESIQVVHLDEGHIAPAGTVQEVLSLMPNAYYRFAYSGTPLARGDLRSLHTIGATGKVIVKIRSQELIQKGFIAKPLIRLVTVHQESMESNPQTRYKDLVIDSEERNNTLIEIMRMAARPGFVFVKRKSHGLKLLKMARKAGIGCEYLDGDEKSTEIRMQKVRRLSRGDYEFLITTKVFQEGVDCEDLLSVILGGAGKSWIEALQMLGRGTRLKKDGSKKSFELWTIADEGEKMLRRWTRSWIKAFQSEGHDLEIGSLADFRKLYGQAGLPGV